MLVFLGLGFTLWKLVLNRPKADEDLTYTYGEMLLIHIDQEEKGQISPAVGSVKIFGDCSDTQRTDPANPLEETLVGGSTLCDLTTTDSSAEYFSIISISFSSYKTGKTYFLPMSAEKNSLSALRVPYFGGEYVATIAEDGTTTMNFTPISR